MPQIPTKEEPKDVYQLYITNKIEPFSYTKVSVQRETFGLQCYSNSLNI